MEWTFSDSVRLSLLSFSEASKACAALPGFSLFRRSLQPERIEYCRAELLPDCLVGSLAVPDKTHPLHLAFSLAFYLDRGQLILAADEQTLPALQSLLFPEEPLDTSDVFHLFFSFLESLIQEDMLAELDYAAIPNFQLMDPQFTHLSFDPRTKITFFPRNAPVSFRALETAWTVCTTTPRCCGSTPCRSARCSRRRSTCVRTIRCGF